jgi:hypothetical protein
MSRQGYKKILWVLPVVAIALMLLIRPVPQKVYAQNIGWPDAPYKPANISYASASPTTIVAAPTAGGVCVYGLTLINGSASTATTINLYLDGGTTSVASVYLGANGGAASWPLISYYPKNPYFLTNNATGFVITSSASVQINGSVYAATCP